MTNPDIDKDGTQRWFNSDGYYHRTGGPAYISASGIQVWIINGKHHRIDGPAITHADGTQVWYVNGTHITSNKQFQKAANLTNEEMMLIVLKYGNIE